MKSGREKILDTQGRVPRIEEGEAGASPEAADYNGLFGRSMDLPFDDFERAILRQFNTWHPTRGRRAIEIAPRLIR